MRLQITRRSALLSLLASTLLAACASRPLPSDPTPPIVFVHGNGDTAALWVPTATRSRRGPSG